MLKNIATCVLGRGRTRPGSDVAGKSGARLQVFLAVCSLRFYSSHLRINRPCLRP